MSSLMSSNEHSNHNYKDRQTDRENERMNNRERERETKDRRERKVIFILNNDVIIPITKNTAAKIQRTNLTMITMLVT